MTCFNFQDHTLLAENVAAVGRVEADAELGCSAFTVYLTGGHEITFRGTVSTAEVSKPLRESYEAVEARAKFIHTWKRALIGKEQ